jgi:hypothetical protein
MINVMLLMIEREGGVWGEILEKKGKIPEEEGGRPDQSPVLAQRAVADSPRWTRAVVDQSGHPFAAPER